MLHVLEWRQWTMGKGLFWFEVGKISDVSLTERPVEYFFENNEFEFVFCQEGCIYSQEIPSEAIPTLVHYHNNLYKDVFAQ
jgi:hypothetical protein